MITFGIARMRLSRLATAASIAAKVGSLGPYSTPLSTLPGLGLVVVVLNPFFPLGTRSTLVSLCGRAVSDGLVHCVLIILFLLGCLIVRKSDGGIGLDSAPCRVITAFILRGST